VRRERLIRMESFSCPES